MSATLSISPFSNFLIITNFLHNYILYAFLFFSFYHKLTINHHFFWYFFFSPTVKQPLSVSLYRGIQIKARHPLTTIYSSLPAIIAIKRSTCGKRVNRQINIAACVSLSATGSSIFPKLLIPWNLLAIYPSARSVRPDSNKISPANRGFFFTQ